VSVDLTSSWQATRSSASDKAGWRLGCGGLRHARMQRTGALGFGFELGRELRDQSPSALTHGQFVICHYGATVTLHPGISRNSRSGPAGEYTTINFIGSLPVFNVE
jgi:hypothetical protein